jgi:hypothetical protein
MGEVSTTLALATANDRSLLLPLRPYSFAKQPITMPLAANYPLNYLAINSLIIIRLE